ncbi:MAG TPA: hypothetical protein VL492_10180 [Methylovirgula sp.]|nr:hypothetical protein [Methylovirgula sp.]
MLKSLVFAGLTAAVIGSQIGSAVAQEQYNPAADFIARLSGSYVPEHHAAAAEPTQDRFVALAGRSGSVHPIRPYFGRD